MTCTITHQLRPPSTKHSISLTNHHAPLNTTNIHHHSPTLLAPNLTRVNTFNHAPLSTICTIIHQLWSPSTQHAPPLANLARPQNDMHRICPPSACMTCTTTTRQPCSPKSRYAPPLTDPDRPQANMNHHSPIPSPSTQRAPSLTNPVRPPTRHQHETHHHLPTSPAAVRTASAALA